MTGRGLVGFLAVSLEALDRWAGAGETPRDVGLGAGQSVRVWRGWGPTVPGLKRWKCGGGGVVRALANGTVSRGALGHSPIACARTHRGMRVSTGLGPGQGSMGLFARC